MDSDASKNRTHIDVSKTKISWGNLIIGMGIMIVLPAAILFGSSGRLDWEFGWFYVGLTAVFTVGSRIIMAYKTPDLIAERGGSLLKENIKPWDKIIMPLTLIGPTIMLIVAGLDARFTWSPKFPLPIHVTGIILATAGYFLSSWAMVVNRFFSASVRIQTERGHTVISSGPYQYIRHPGYAGGVLSSVAVPLLLGSFWALVPAILVIILMVVRTGLEDTTLLEELEGYRKYATSVRHRLIPGVW